MTSLRVLAPSLFVLLTSSLVTACGSSDDGSVDDGGAGGLPDSSAGDGSLDGSLDANVDTTPVRDAPSSVDAHVDCTSAAGKKELACTGLYADWGTRTIAPGVLEYRPGFELWSDGAAKRRWLYLPPGTKIDVSNLDEWVFPVGTKLWKEFSLPVGGLNRQVETREMEKTADGAWRRATYLWSADGTSAPEITDGAPLLPGTDHYSVPAVTACVKCHGGRADNVLGLDAVLSAAPEATGLTWADLQTRGLVTSTNGNHLVITSALQITGNDVERPALGLLHANCGVACHNVNDPGAHFNARLDVVKGALPTLFATGVYRTTINALSSFRPKTATGELYYRVRPGDVAHSTLAYRMSVRDIDAPGSAPEQMPPLASNLVDTKGRAIIEKWIGAMSPDGGYPEAGTLDGGTDTAPPDTSIVDSSKPDTTVVDSGAPDTSVVDASSDAATCALPPLKLTLLPGSYTQPLFVTSPPGDATRLFVVEKGGTIRILQGGAVLATPFLTVSDAYMPDPAAEGGLLGLAFHPNYATNGRFFVHYTSSPSGNVVVREFHRSAADPNRADAAPVKTLLDKPHGGWNHCGGMLAFDKGGLLYASVGDTATFPSPARNLASHLGKILRFDVDSTTAPAGNLTGAGVFPFIWDYGLRNPWRFSFDRSTGDLYIGDVGQKSWEEIEVEPALSGKRDYGWDVMEGAHCYPPGSTCTITGVLPTVEHSQASGEASSIVGGYVYRGSAIACLRGHYVYGDYSTARIFSFVWNGASAISKLDLSTDLNPGGSPAAHIASFGEDASGELYVVTLFPGRVYRIEPE